MGLLQTFYTKGGHPASIAVPDDSDGPDGYFPISPHKGLPLVTS